jgi:hypothetical protein
MKTKHLPKPTANTSNKVSSTRPGPLRRALHARWMPAAMLLSLVVFYYWPIITLQGFLWNDFIEQNFPYRLFAAVSLKHGVLPFWTPYIFSGMPFFADVQAAVLYPLNLALTFFTVNDWLSPIAVEYQVLFHIFLAGVFMYLLAREFGCNRHGSLLSAVTFMFCGFFTTHVFHVNLIHTAAWFPLIILLQTRALRRPSLLYAALTAMVLCAVFLSGYPQLMLHMYYWMAAYYVFLLVIAIKAGTTFKAEVFRGAVFGAIVALGLGMSALQLLPTQDLAKNSVRPKLEFSESCEGSLRPFRLVTLLAPNYFGRPDKNNYWGIGKNDFNGGVHYYWETAIYTGLAPLALAALAAFFVRTPLSLFLAIMGILSFLLAMGDSFFLYGIFFHALPGLKSFRVPGRFAFMFSTSIALLAGFGLQWLQNRGTADVSEKTRTIVVRTALIAAGLCLLWALFASFGALKESVIDFLLNARRFGSDTSGIGRFVEERLYPQIIGSLWLCAVFFAGTATIVVLRLREKISAKMTGALLCGITMVDLSAFGFGFASSETDPRQVYMKTPAVEQAQQQQGMEFFRINSRDSHPGTDDLGGAHMAFYKNQGNVHRIFLMEGYNPLRLKRQLVDRKEKTLDILNIKYSLQVDPRRQSMGFVERGGYCPRCRMVYDYMVEPNESGILPALYNDSFNHKTSVVLEENPGFAPIAGVAGDSSKCRITSYSLNSITMDVTTPRPGLLTLSEIYYPEWKAKVDGAPAPLYRADYALRAIPVSAGRHTVTCFYDPRAFEKGLRISLVACVLTIALGAAGLLLRKKTG